MLALIEFFYQDQFINEYATKKKAKIPFPLSQSPGVFFSDI